LGWPSGSEIEEIGKEGFAAMMGQGFGDEIGAAIVRLMVLIAVVAAIGGLGMFWALSWLGHHIAIHWK
jgi:hypothetical protein